MFSLAELGFEEAVPTQEIEEQRNLCSIVDAEEIGIIDLTEREGSWLLPKLYKESAVGNTMVWQVGYNSSNNKIIMAHGILGGVIQIDKVDVELNASGRNLQQQALVLARSKYQNKVKNYYRESLERIDRSTKELEPMLAEKYNPEGKTNVTSLPVCVQAKLDGVRAIISFTDNVVTIRSRKNTCYPHLTHLKLILSQLFLSLPEATVLDGELYNHDMSFEELTSAVKTERRVPERNKDIKFFMFDAMFKDTSIPYTRRHKILSDALSTLDPERIDDKVQLLPFHMVGTHAEIDSYLQHFLEEGYEGLMIRYPHGLYKNKRTKDLLKYKQFIDEEGIVVEVYGGKGRDEKLALLVVRDSEGNLLHSKPAFTFDTRRKWYEDPSLILGKVVTFRYANRTNKGCCRFIVVVAVRDYE